MSGTGYDAVRYDSAPVAGLPARRLAVVIATRDVLVEQCPGVPRLGLEPSPGLGLMGVTGVRQLDGDRSRQHGITGPPYLAEPADTDCSSSR